MDGIGELLTRPSTEWPVSWSHHSLGGKVRVTGVDLARENIEMAKQLQQMKGASLAGWDKR